MVLQFVVTPHFLMCFLPTQNFAWTRNMEQHFIAHHSRAELWHWPHPTAVGSVHLWGWFPPTDTSPTWIISICRGLHVWECALSISQGVTYCLEAARVTYTCTHEHSWVLLKLSRTWEQCSSASVRGCLNFSGRTQAWIILVLTHKFHSLPKFELFYCIFLSLGCSLIAWGKSILGWKLFLVAISQNNHAVLQNYKKSPLLSL